LRKKYEHSTFSYGLELELSDVPRSVEIPEHLGAWEFSERDIVNTKPPFLGIAADPKGLEPPIGGEINTVPTKTIEEQVSNVADIFSVFRNVGWDPAVGPTSHGHVHIHIPGLTEDIEALKRLARFIYRNQDEMIYRCGRFEKHPSMDAKAVMYMKLDGGRKLPEYIVKNILERATDLKSFIDMHCMGKDGVSRGRPFRYAINMYSLKHTQTIEFRMFRATTSLDLIYNCLEVVSAFMDQAMMWDGDDNSDSAVFHVPKKIEYPPMMWDRSLWDSLQKTKHPETRGKKVRSFKEVK
jgi:hypothetical protein